jgi:large subunit ribosomal protein L6
MLTRLERKELKISNGITVTIDKKSSKVLFEKGPLNLEYIFNPLYVTPSVVDDVLVYKANEKTNKSAGRKAAGAHLGTAIAISANHLEGLNKPFVIDLVLKGTGYKVAQKKQGKDTVLEFNLGKSHADIFVIPEDVTVNCSSATEISLQSSNKQLLGQVAANIRKLRPVDSYKGKGVLFKGQVVSLKETKKK